MTDLPRNTNPVNKNNPKKKRKTVGGSGSKVGSSNKPFSDEEAEEAFEWFKEKYPQEVPEEFEEDIPEDTELGALFRKPEYLGKEYRKNLYSERIDLSNRGERIFEEDYLKKNNLRRQDTIDPKSDMTVMNMDRITIGSLKRPYDETEEDYDKVKQEMVLPDADALLMIPAENRSLSGVDDEFVQRKLLGIPCGGGGSNFYLDDTIDLKSEDEFGRILAHEIMMFQEALVPISERTHPIKETEKEKKKREKQQKEVGENVEPPKQTSTVNPYPPRKNDGSYNENFIDFKKVKGKLKRLHRNLFKAQGKVYPRKVGETKEQETEELNAKIWDKKPKDTLTKFRDEKGNEVQFETSVKDSEDFFWIRYGEDPVEKYGSMTQESTFEEGVVFRETGGYAALKSKMINKTTGEEKIYELKEAIDLAPFLEFGDTGQENVIRKRIEGVRNLVKEIQKENPKAKISDNKIDQVIDDLNKIVDIRIEEYKKERNKISNGNERNRQLRKNLLGQTITTKEIDNEEIKKITENKKNYSKGDLVDYSSNKLFGNLSKEEGINSAGEKIIRDSVEALTATLSRDVYWLGSNLRKTIPLAALYKTLNSFDHETDEKVVKEKGEEYDEVEISKYQDKTDVYYNNNFYNIKVSRKKAPESRKKIKQQQLLNEALNEVRKEINEARSEFDEKLFSETKGWRIRDSETIKRRNKVNSLMTRIFEQIQRDFFDKPMFKSSEDMLDWKENKQDVSLMDNIYTSFDPLFNKEKMKKSEFKLMSETEKQATIQGLNIAIDKIEKEFDKTIKDTFDKKIKIEKKLKGFTEEELDTFTKSTSVKKLKRIPSENENVTVFEGTLKDVIQGLEVMNDIRANPIKEKRKLKLLIGTQSKHPIYHEQRYADYDLAVPAKHGSDSAQLDYLHRKFLYLSERRSQYGLILKDMFGGKDEMEKTVRKVDKMFDDAVETSIQSKIDPKRNYVHPMDVYKGYKLYPDFLGGKEVSIEELINMMEVKYKSIVGHKPKKTEEVV